MISKAIQALIDVFRFHKTKVFAVVISALLFSLYIFPYSDLGDYVSLKVAELSHNQVYVQFDGLDLNLFPQPGLQMENVDIESGMLPELTVDSLSFSPSISGLLSFKPGVSIYARGLMGGRLSLSTRGGDKTKNGTRRQLISLSTSRLDMGKIANFAELPIPLKGKLTLNSSVTLDPDFSEQPRGDLQIQIDKFEIVSSVVPTVMGPTNVPSLAVSAVTLSGSLADGRFNIEDGRIGDPKDELSGTIKGEILLRIDKIGTRPTLSMTGYTLDVDLTAQKSYLTKLGPYSGLFDKYKKPAPNGSRYTFRLTPTACSQDPLCMTPL